MHLTCTTCIWHVPHVSDMYHMYLTCTTCIWHMSRVSDICHLGILRTMEWQRSETYGSTKAGNLMRSRRIFPLIFGQEWKLCIYEWYSVLFLLLPSLGPLILLGTFLFIQPQFMILCYVRITGTETCTFSWPTCINNFQKLLQSSCENDCSYHSEESHVSGRNMLVTTL